MATISAKNETIKGRALLVYAALLKRFVPLLYHGHFFVDQETFSDVLLLR